MYFTIQNSEDGLRVDSYYDERDLLDHIEELTSEDIRPECRAVFVDELPDEYTSTYAVYIIKGENLMPKARERVVEWTLDGD